MTEPGRSRGAGVLAIVGGSLALVLTIPFSAAFHVAYPGFNELPVWFHALRPVLAPLLEFGDSTDVYATYGRIYDLVYLCLLPAALVARRRYSLGRSRAGLLGYRLTIAGLVAAFIGVAGDYWADGLGYPLELLGLLALAVGCTLLGMAWRRGAAPAPVAWLFMACGPAYAPGFLLVGHVPSGPTLPIAIAFIGLGIALSRRSDTPMRDGTRLGVTGHTPGPHSDA